MGKKQTNWDFVQEETGFEIALEPEIAYINMCKRDGVIVPIFCEKSLFFCCRKMKEGKLKV